MFASRSYAGGFPHDADLLLEAAWEIDEYGELGEGLGYPVYIPGSQIAWIDVLASEDGLEEEALHG